MAADILLYDAELVPVGKDQMQHIEMARDVASRFHAKMGEVFVLPEGVVQENTMLIPGTDGAKMSKSKNNTINLFLPEKELRKQIMTIQTDSKGLNDVKNPDECNVFGLYKLLASEKEIEQMKANYAGANYGYGHAKQELFELILSKYSAQRAKYTSLMLHPEEIENALQVGAEKARKIAKSVLTRVRESLGY